MNWDAFGAIAELLGAIAVFTTLVYLAIQVRQNSQAIRSSTRSEIAKTQMDISFILAANPNLAEAAYGVIQGRQDIPEKEARAASQYLSGMFRTFESQFFAYREGNFPESVWVGYRRNIGWNVRQPGFAEYWKSRRPLFSDEFAEFLEELAQSSEGDF